VLSVNPLTGDAFTLAVNNAVDALGNVTNRSYDGTLLTLQARDLGSPGSDPRDTGSTVPFAEDDFNSVGGGSTIWGTSDACQFVSEPRTGDFDVRVQITQLDRTGGASDGGIELRQTLAANSAKVLASIEPYSGGQKFWLGVRATAARGVSYPAGFASSDNWLRLLRQGSVFIGFHSTNGVDWSEYCRLTNNFSTTGYLGLVTCSDDNTSGRAVTAWYRSYGDFGPGILTQPQSQSVASGPNVTFGVTARGLPLLTYQWQLNGIPLPGETNSLLQLLAVTTNRVGNYRVVVNNPYGAASSQEALLAVDGVGMGGFEADLNPAPLGNNAVTVSDWVKVGRMVAGLDAPLNSSEFARADCAPRTNALLGTLPLGDGRLSVVDWTQAGRYAAGVDPLTPAGGPIAAANFAPGGNVAVMASDRQAKDDVSVRSLRLVGSKAVAGQILTVPVELTALGGENALGFSVQFDPSRLSYQGAALAEGAAGAALQVNPTLTDGGSVGVVLAKSIGQGFAAGTVAVVQLQFLAVGATGTNVVSFGDTPVWREVADVGAGVQPTAFIAGAVRVVAAERMGVRWAIGVRRLVGTWPPGRPTDSPESADGSGAFQASSGRESQGDSGAKPGVARNELPWENVVPTWPTAPGLTTRGRWALARGLALTAALLLAMVGVLPLAAQTGCLPPPSGVVAWWPGDGHAFDLAGTMASASWNTPTRIFQRPWFIPRRLPAGATSPWSIAIASPLCSSTARRFAPA
jgi:hypothetical protein